MHPSKVGSRVCRENENRLGRGTHVRFTTGKDRLDLFTQEKSYSSVVDYQGAVCTVQQFRGQESIFLKY